MSKGFGLLILRRSLTISIKVLLLPSLTTQPNILISFLRLMVLLILLLLIMLLVICALMTSRCSIHVIHPLQVYDRMVDSTPEYTPQGDCTEGRKFQIVRDYLNTRHTVEDDGYRLFNDFDLYLNEISIQNLSACADDFVCDEF